MQKVLQHLGGVKCQPFLKCSAYCVADLLINFQISHYTINFCSLCWIFFLSLFVFVLFQATSIHQGIPWLSSLQTSLGGLNFHLLFGYLLPVLFNSLVYQTICNIKLRGMKEFSNGPIDKREGCKSSVMD